MTAGTHLGIEVAEYDAHPAPSCPGPADTDTGWCADTAHLVRLTPATRP